MATLLQSAHAPPRSRVEDVPPGDNKGHRQQQERRPGEPQLLLDCRFDGKCNVSGSQCAEVAGEAPLVHRADRPITDDDAPGS